MVTHPNIKNLLLVYVHLGCSAILPGPMVATAAVRQLMELSELSQQEVFCHSEWSTCKCSKNFFFGKCFKSALNVFGASLVEVDDVGGEVFLVDGRRGRRGNLLRLLLLRLLGRLLGLLLLFLLLVLWGKSLKFRNMVIIRLFQAE